MNMIIFQIFFIRLLRGTDHVQRRENLTQLKLGRFRPGGRLAIDGGQAQLVADLQQVAQVVIVHITRTGLSGFRSRQGWFLSWFEHQWFGAGLGLCPGLKEPDQKTDEKSHKGQHNQQVKELAPQAIDDVRCKNANGDDQDENGQRYQQKFVF